MRIRARLLLSHLLLVLTVLVLVGAGHLFAFRSRLNVLLLENLEHSALLAAESFRDLPPDAPAESVDALAERIGDATALRVTVIDTAGNVVGDSDVRWERLPGVESHAGRPEVVGARRHGRATATRTSTTVGQTMVYAAVALPDGRVVRVASDVEQIRAATSAVLPTTLLIGVTAAVAASIVALLLSGELARPIQALTAASRAMAAGDLERRAGLRSRDELGELGAALDNLARSFATTIGHVEAERNRLAGVLAGMVEGVLVVDESGHIQLVNPSLRESLGLHGEILGRTVLETIRSAELHEAVRLALEERRYTPRSITLRGPPEKTFEIRFSVLRGGEAGLGEAGESRVTGLIAVFHDVTELNRLEQVRRDFVANASHELKTPVAAILGASETLAGGAIGDPEAAPRFLSSIERNARRLAALVEDLLDLSRLESRETPELRAVRPEDALQRAAAPFLEQAAGRSIQVEVAPFTGTAVRGDPGLMDRALSNLVQNAVRYTPEGGRVVLRALDTTGEDGPAVRFEIEDTGIGIPPHALPRIFERFFRVDPARSRELGGTGLGLAIVKHAVEAMGGTVAVESRPGAGSTFSFTLRAYRAP